MKRLLRTLLTVLLLAAVVFGVLELGYRGYLSMKGGGHSSAAQRDAWVAQLQWIVRPHGPLAMGDLKLTEANEDDLNVPIQGTALSPYIGVDRIELLNGYGAAARYFETPEAEEVFDVVLLGGSVASILAGDEVARARFEEILAADPRLAGRPVRMHGQARPGFKAPQTSILMDMLFQLGWKPDMVVLLDGFNEVALANENRRMGGHPIYPSVVNWAHLTPEVDYSGDDIKLLAEMEIAKGEQRSLLETALRGRLQHSALASKLVDTLASRPMGRHARAKKALEERRHATAMPLSLRGPEPPADFDAALAGMIRIWTESAVSLNAACSVRGIPFLHVLQPTLYDEGAKPFTERERTTCRISDEWKEGVVPGYPLLRAGGVELAERGVEFLDASRIFADYTGELYNDSCHFGPPGSKRLAEFMAEGAGKMQD